MTILMKNPKRLEDTPTAEIIARAFDAKILQLRQGDVYYGGCTKVADSPEHLVGILDDDPDFLDQLYLASQRLDEQFDHAENHPSALPLPGQKNSAGGMALGAIAPQLAEAAAGSCKNTDNTAPESSLPEKEPVEEITARPDEELVLFLASPEGKEARAALQKDVNAVQLAVRTEVSAEQELPSIENFRREHLAPLVEQLKMLETQEGSLRARAAGYSSARSEADRLLCSAGDFPHLAAVLEQRFDKLEDPSPKLTRVEGKIKAVKDAISGVQAEEETLRQRWANLQKQADTITSDHPTILLAAAVEQALSSRRSSDLSRLMGLIGSQSNRTVIKLAERSDLGLEGIKAIRLAVSSRKWVHAITPVARKLAAEIAQKGAFEGKRLPGNARTIILRAEHILVLDQTDSECARIHVGPDGIGRWSKGQPGRPWRVKKEDTWIL
jgi:hypothetical protein